MTKEEVKEYYGKKYRKILKELENKKAEKYEIDDNCGIWLEMWCKVKGEKLKINIGIDDKYHTRYKNQEILTWKSQDEVDRI